MWYPRIYFCFQMFERALSFLILKTMQYSAAMPSASTLMSFPKELFQAICASLDDRDLINLSRANKVFYSLIKDDDFVTRKTVEVRISQCLSEF